MRILHTMLRVADLEKSKAFYTRVLGMKLFHEHEFPQGKFSLAFLGYGDEKQDAVLELTWNWDRDAYEMGDAYGHIAIGVDDVYAACDRIRAAGGEVVRDAGPMQGSDVVLAFVKDPDGYMIELLAEGQV